MTKEIGLGSLIFLDKRESKIGRVIRLRYYTACEYVRKNKLVCNSGCTKCNAKYNPLILNKKLIFADIRDLNNVVYSKEYKDLEEYKISFDKMKYE